MIGLDSELIGIDTNVVLRAVLDDDPAQSPPAAALFRSFSSERLGFIAQATLAEVYWVLARSLRMSRDECLAVIRTLVQTATLEFDDGEGVVQALALAEEGADFADALIEGTMNQFGVTETVTFDRHASEHLGWRLLDVGDRP